jgi:hypothetical protein
MISQPAFLKGPYLGEFGLSCLPEIAGILQP